MGFKKEGSGGGAGNREERETIHSSLGTPFWNKRMRAADIVKGQTKLIHPFVLSAPPMLPEFIWGERKFLCLHILGG